VVETSGWHLAGQGSIPHGGDLFRAEVWERACCSFGPRSVPSVFSCTKCVGIENLPSSKKNHGYVGLEFQEACNKSYDYLIVINLSTPYFQYEFSYLNLNYGSPCGSCCSPYLITRDEIGMIVGQF
jgi:hypothetical protein